MKWVNTFIEMVKGVASTFWTWLKEKMSYVKQLVMHYVACSVRAINKASENWGIKLGAAALVATVLNIAGAVFGTIPLAAVFLGSLIDTSLIFTALLVSHYVGAFIYNVYSMWGPDKWFLYRKGPDLKVVK